MEALKRLEEQLQSRGVELGFVMEKLENFKIEIPAWAFGNSRTRFALFTQQGMPRNPLEKLEDIAAVNRYTGIAPSVALSVISDCDKDLAAIAQKAKELGLLIGAINPDFFSDPAYRFGSVCNADPAARQVAYEHMAYSVEIGKKLGSKAQSLWIPDGTNYPGQGNFREKRGLLRKFLEDTYRMLPDDTRMFVEYKLYEPAFYHTDLADWGCSLVLCKDIGERAQVLVDLGHHAHGVNVEHIVATLLDENKLGGFHLNSRKSADDDLMTGAINPQELFLIMKELVDGGLCLHTQKTAQNVAYMIDQSHCIEPKVPAMILSVVNTQIAYCKALLIDRARLQKAQAENDVITASECIREAFETDVAPLLAAFREQKGLASNPIKAYMASGFEALRVKNRG